jgi:peptidoglycan hydrolase CwlO-like protein
MNFLLFSTKKDFEVKQMNMPMKSVSADPSFARTGHTAKSKRKTYLLLFVGWFVLIAIGIAGAKLYTDHLKQQIAADIASQTQQQLEGIQADYQKQVSELKTDMTSSMTKLQTKVDSLNQLLAFTKDSANSKTDNSNQLYTQLAEVKKKLDELQKNLEVLK